MYPTVKLFSSLIRNFVLPNPFEQLPMTYNSLPMSIFALFQPSILFSLAVIPIHKLSYFMTRLYYHRPYDSKAKGSILYLFFFVVYSALLYIMAKFSFSPTVIFLSIISYACFHIGVILLINWSNLHSFF
ncbi:hypothetical protein SAMN04515656_1162 [Eubacterium aggregans]|uniref:Uncharacterized protein n=1 Tax=Eubacterium aggregans TaxID=81409 RepID=A0A1H4CK82_9FIRM|nr:hypothetical protein SAMN04515656_1162 [Eubacterium aggregans]